MRTVIGIITALTLGGCVDAAIWAGVEVVGEAVYWCERNCATTNKQPDCPPDVDPAAVTWCRVVTPR